MEASRKRAQNLEMNKLQTATITAQPGQVVIVQVPYFGMDPVKITCSQCKASITTTVQPKRGALAWAACCCLCPVGCCWIPLKGTMFMDIEHYCPLCDQKLGAFIRL